MWTRADIPDQHEKTAIITGGNSGIGFHTALALCDAGAHVIIAGRDAKKIQQAADRINQGGGQGKASVGILNLDSLVDVRRFSEDFASKHQHLHLLINNAGVMVPPESKTADGYELQFGVNFLGHFALTGHMYPLLKQTPGARVVTLCSGAYKSIEGIDFGNLRGEKPYDPYKAYAVSKFADLQFMLEFQRRIDVFGDTMISAAAHPGVTQTDLSRHMAEDVYKAALLQFGELMPASQGALPTLFAATSNTVNGGEYYGPDGEHELRGYPALAEINNTVKDAASGRILWEYAENATALHYPFSSAV